tara:strand:+ start:267 stop:1376 length:1110 start_codon:yes stop_codon:yes gene_type:complete
MTKAAELAKMGEVLTNSQIGGRRNILYNSKFEVAQRGTSFSQGTGGDYLLDRWRPAIGSAFNLDTTISQSTTVPSGQGFKHSLKVEADSVVSPNSNQNGGIAQYLEGQDVDHLAYGTSSAESLTLSFWVRSNKTGTYCVQLMMNVGAGSGSERQMHIKEYTISSANTWEKKTLTFTGNTSQAITQTNTDGFRVIWWLSTGSGDYQSADSWISSPAFASTSNQVNFMDSADNEWYLCGCQLEVGEQATPFEHRSFGEELALCQRYFAKSYNHSVTPGTAPDFVGCPGRFVDATSSYASVQVFLPVTMRATPTVTLFNPSTGATASIRSDSTDHAASTSQIGETGFFFFANNSSIGTSSSIRGHYTAEAEL